MGRAPNRIRKSARAAGYRSAMDSIIIASFVMRHQAPVDHSIRKLDVALLEERLYRLCERLRIVDVQATGELDRFAFRKTMAVGDMHRGHDALNASGPHVRDPLGNLTRLGEHFATRNDMIYGAERMRLVRGDLASGQRKLD